MFIDRHIAILALDGTVTINLCAYGCRTPQIYTHINRFPYFAPEDCRPGSTPKSSQGIINNAYAFLYLLYLQASNV